MVTERHKSMAVAHITVEVDPENVQDFINDWESICAKLNELADVTSAELELPPSDRQVIKLRTY